jgi:hypothetical protein
MADGFPIRATAPVPITHREHPLTTVGIWPQAPLLTVSASRPEDLLCLARFLFDGVERLEGVSLPVEQIEDSLRAAWKLDALDNEWDASVDETAFVLLDVDTSETTPVPEASLVLRARNPVVAPHPLKPLIPKGHAIPYEWEGRAGLIAPWLGEKWSLCIAADGRDWIAATQERIMPTIMAAQRNGSAHHADLVVEVDWPRLAEVSENLVRTMAQNELLPRLDADDATEKVLPFMQAIASLGTMRLEGVAGKECLQLSGYLAKARPPDSPGR